MRPKETYLVLWVFLECDFCLHKLPADGSHELFGLSCASPSMEYSYLNMCYLAVAAHGGVDIRVGGCCVWIWGNCHGRLDVGTEGWCCVHSLCLQQGRHSALFLSNLARRSVWGGSPPGVCAPVEALLYADGRDCC